MIERRTALGEIRVEARVISGMAIVYGDVAPTYRERFAPGSIVLDSRTRWLDVEHNIAHVIAFTNGGGLELRSKPEGLELNADLPTIPLANAALAQARQGRFSLSLEFESLEERRENGLRVITRADVSGVGLVRSAAYQQSTIEVRSGAIFLEPVSTPPEDWDW